MSADIDDPAKETEEPFEDEENFADLLAAYDAGMREDIKRGDKISGKIIAIDKDAVFVDTGTKIDGVVQRAELLDDNGEMAFKIGDKVDLFVVAASESEIQLSRALSGAGGYEILKDAQTQGIPVEGKVAAVIKGGFQVTVLKRRAFCPMSQMDVRPVNTPEDFVGQTLQFKIKRLEENGRNIVLSRRELLEAEQKIACLEFLPQVQIDAVLQGRVTRLMPYGAFVELVPGLEGLVHISELSWSRVENPESLLSVGDRIKVKVIGIEPGADVMPKRVNLSIKQALEDPWLRLHERIRPGDVLDGQVSRLADFGAFVEIEPGVDGLVHISELSYEKRVARPGDVVQEGEAVRVKVKTLDPERRRLSLSLRDVKGDPWQEVEKNFAKGTRVNGTLEKKERFGWFVNLAPGITGLLPKSAIARFEDQAALEKLNPGDSLPVAVEELRPNERKITLSPAASADARNWQEYQAPSDRPLSDLAEKLKQALNK